MQLSRVVPDIQVQSPIKIQISSLAFPDNSHTSIHENIHNVDVPRGIRLSRPNCCASRGLEMPAKNHNGTGGNIEYYCLCNILFNRLRLNSKSTFICIFIHKII
jgi:hypothetical protein